MKMYKMLISSVLISAIIVTGCSNTSPSSPNPTNQAESRNAVTFEDIHGIGYTSNGKQIIIPSHTGLILYENNQWRKANTEGNDYMGYIAVNDGFYSSGHPGPSSSRKNPLGLVKGTENGDSLQTLGFEGEIDFHLMGVGYNNHAIYVKNETPVSTLPAGFFRSFDEAKTWTALALNGLEGDAISIAVHPESPTTVAIGTDKGLFISEDSGDHFQRLTPALQITSVTFSNDGTKLIVGEWKDGALLVEIDWKTKETKGVAIPTLGQDAVAYLAMNPKNQQEAVFATFNKNVYISKDNFKTWTQLVKEGVSTN